MQADTRFRQGIAIAACVMAVVVFATQLLVILDPEAALIIALFPAWPHDVAYDAYLRGLAWADILCSMPLTFLAGVGLWKNRRWGYALGVGTGCIGLYYTIMQVIAQIIIGGDYSLFGLGALGKPLQGTGLDPWFVDWFGLLPWSVLPVVIGIYSAQMLLDPASPPGETGESPASNHSDEG